jgi:[ribosomal protein S5]-alanine N-acetyltransferase
MPLPLYTRRLSIRPLTPADGADVYAVFAAPEVMRHWNSAPPADLSEAGEWAARLADLQRRLGYAQWRVAELATRRLVGIAGLQPLDGGPEVELTYALVPEAWGRGYATEAATAVLGFGLGELGLERVVGIARPENGASLAVLRKVGLRSLGEAEYWGKRWEKFELAAADWRAEGAAARPPLLTERLELRRIGSPDLGPLLVAFGDPAVMRYVGSERQPLTGDALRVLMRTADGHWSQHGFGLLAVAERESGRVIGEAGLQVLEAGPDIELGYTLRHAVWSRGYATEAARAVLYWAFAGLRLERVVAVADPANEASLHVLDKLGLRRLGMRHCYGTQMVEAALSLSEWRALAGPSPAAG